MHPAGIPDLVIRRRSDLLDAPDNRRLARAVAEGAWTRITRGAYVASAAWSALDPMERHRIRVAEILRRQKHPTIVSHLSAAAFWNIDVLGDWPHVLEVTVERATGGRSDGTVRRYAWGTDGVHSTPWRMHRITTPAQTALDLARSLPFVRAVTAVDEALRRGRLGGPLTTKAEILALMDASPRRGDARARRVIEFSTDLSDSVRESQGRVLLMQLGFPAPRLQEKRVLRSGRVAYADYYFAEFDHWCETDGRFKYTDPRFAHGRTPEQVVIDEKNRENEIRREVRAFSRWEATDADDPRLIYDILTAAGLPSTKPRP